MSAERMSAEPARIASGDWIQMGLLTCLWGSSFLLYRFLDRSFAPSIVVFGRLSLGAVLLNLVLAVRRTRLRWPGRDWPSLLLLGFLNNAAPFTLIAVSETRLTSGLAATIGATAPLFAMIVVIARRQARLDLRRGGALCIGLTGVATATGALSGGMDVPAWAIGTCLASAFLYAIGGLYTGRFKSHEPLQVATAQLTAGAILMFALVTILGGTPKAGSFTAANIGAFLAMGALCTAFPYVVYFAVVRRVGPNNILLVTMMIPAASQVLAWPLLGEPVLLRQIGGMALILLSLLIVDGRLSVLSRRLVRQSVNS